MKKALVHLEPLIHLEDAKLQRQVCSVVAHIVKHSDSLAQPSTVMRAVQLRPSELRKTWSLACMLVECISADF